MARKDAGVASGLAGIFVGLVGFYVYNFQAVCFIGCYRPHEGLGLMVIGFGMALFVLGIALIATARTKAT